MVAVHVLKPINPALVCVVPHSAERAVGLAFSLGFLCLLSVRDPLYLSVENPDLQQLRVYRTAEEILEDSFAPRHIQISSEPFHILRHLLRIVGLAVVLLVQPAPLQSAHFWE